ncbi:MAG TPA: hypothetical protein VH022_06385 [Candidatus Acidoferrum sp.]|nr:hypothetical protein [Candidatus Acidoferrum sp.]
MSILVGVALFLLALAVSATIIPQLRPLHALQSLIYVAVLILTRRNSPWGFGAGTIIAIAWNSLNLFITHLFQAGAGQLWILLHGRHVTRPDTAMVTIGGIGHFILIAACIAGFLEQKPRAKNWAQFFAGGLLALAYMALIIATTAPR